MTVEQIKDDIKFSGHAIWLLKIKGAKDYSYTSDAEDMTTALTYFENCYNRLPDGEFELTLRKHKNQSKGQLVRTFIKGGAGNNTPSVNGTNTASIGSTQWGIGQVINEMEQRFDLRLKNDRLDRENKELRQKIAELENAEPISGTQQLLEKFEPYIQHMLNYHYPVQGAAVGTLKANKGDTVPADGGEPENISEEQLTRLWAICERFAAVFGTSDFDELLTNFEKFATKAETMPAVVKGLLI